MIEILFKNENFILTSFFYILVIFHIYITYKLLLFISRILSRWDELLQRHRFFIPISIVFFVCHIKAVLYNSHFSELIIWNFYVIFLQVSWKFSTGSNFDTILISEDHSDRNEVNVDEQELDHDLEIQDKEDLDTRDNSLSVSIDHLKE